MKLWIDDIRNAPDETWTVARTVNSAIKALAMFTFDEISLDHDISHQVGMDELSRPYPCTETFQAVAHYIAAQHEANPVWKPRIIVHSSNPVGGADIAAILAAGSLKVEMRPMGAVNRLEMEV